MSTPITTTDVLLISRKCFLGIQHACHEQDADGSQEDKVGAMFREKQNRELCEHRHNGNPRMEIIDNSCYVQVQRYACATNLSRRKINCNRILTVSDVIAAFSINP